MELVINVLLLTGLIALVLILAWKYQSWTDRRAEKRRCPRCQGMSKQQAFDSGGFIDWCPTHRDTWYEASSIWVR